MWTCDCKSIKLHLNSIMESKHLNEPTHGEEEVEMKIPSALGIYQKYRMKLPNSADCLLLQLLPFDWNDGAMHHSNMSKGGSSNSKWAIVPFGSATAYRCASSLTCTSRPTRGLTCTCGLTYVRTGSRMYVQVHVCTCGLTYSMCLWVHVCTCRLTYQEVR